MKKLLLLMFMSQLSFAQDVVEEGEAINIQGEDPFARYRSSGPDIDFEASRRRLGLPPETNRAPAPRPPTPRTPTPRPAVPEREAGSRKPEVNPANNGQPAQDVVMEEQAIHIEGRDPIQELDASYIPEADFKRLRSRLGLDNSAPVANQCQITATGNGHYRFEIGRMSDERFVRSVSSRTVHRQIEGAQEVACAEGFLARCKAGIRAPSSGSNNGPASYVNHNTASYCAEYIQARNARQENNNQVPVSGARSATRR